MVQLGAENDKLCAITAAMPDGTGLLPFMGAFPQRTFDVGIAEEHAVSMAGGLAKQGMVPVVAIYSTFLQRSFDQILQDVAMIEEIEAEQNQAENDDPSGQDTGALFTVEFN